MAIGDVVLGPGVFRTKSLISSRFPKYFSLILFCIFTIFLSIHKIITFCYCWLEEKSIDNRSPLFEESEWIGLIEVGAEETSNLSIYNRIEEDTEV